jgi:hypothetical protein
MVKDGTLKKILNTIKLMLGANKIGDMLDSIGSLIGKASVLKSSFTLMNLFA